MKFNDKKSSQDFPPGDDNRIFRHRRQYWLVLLAVFALGAAIILYANYQFSLEDSKLWGGTELSQKKAEPPVRVQIEFSLENKRAFEGRARAGMSVEGAIVRAATVAGLDLKIEDESVRFIGQDKSGDKGRLWKLYLNGEVAQGALSRPVLAGDRIVLRYE